MSLAAWMPSSLRFFSICLLLARAARSSADEAQPMAIARTAWLATRGSAVLLACSRLVVARVAAHALAGARVRARGEDRAGATSVSLLRAVSLGWHSTNDGSRTPATPPSLRRPAPASPARCPLMPPDTLITPSIELTANTRLFSLQYN